MAIMQNSIFISDAQVRPAGISVEEGINTLKCEIKKLAKTKSETFRKAVRYDDAYDAGTILGYLGGHATNDLTEVRNDASSYELSFIADYDKSFADSHNFNAMLGYEEYYYYHEALEASSTSMAL